MCFKSPCKLTRNTKLVVYRFKKSIKLAKIHTIENLRKQLILFEMKFMLFSIIIFPSILIGQTINHFENLDSKWHVAKTYPAGNQQNPTFIATTTNVYGFQGDTLINNVSWNKLYATSDSSFQNNLIYQGLLRAENNKVFFLDTLNQLDTLYNFNLNLGDSVLFDLYETNSEWLQVIDIDSVLISGVYYKRLHFEEPQFSAFDVLNEVWIEDIGSIHGPLFPKFPVKFSSEIPDSVLLTCTYSQSQQIWQHPNYTICYINHVLSMDEVLVAYVEVYPNPFTTTLNIENSDVGQYKLSLVSHLGQLVKQVYINTPKSTIDLSKLKAGIYFLKIENQYGIQTIKLIKK